jgi:hypothetical protein
MEQCGMSEAIFSTIKEGDTGKLVAISVPYDLSMLDTEDDIALARAIHDGIQARIQEWFEEGFVQNLYA